nr:hypothetical protein [Lysobacter enzymogenes]
MLVRAAVAAGAAALAVTILRRPLRVRRRRGLCGLESGAGGVDRDAVASAAGYIGALPA